MSPETALIRLPEMEFEFIDHSVSEGYYADRDEFIRAAVRLLIHDMSKRKLSEAKRSMEKIPHDRLLQTIKESRKEVYQQIWDD
jgi:Arc/MetJ-type ribon-helix-helix transcriptional regulator